MNAREHIRIAETFSDGGDDGYLHALLAIAVTLADMADMDADTRTQPAVKPAVYEYPFGVDYDDRIPT